MKTCLIAAGGRMDIPFAGSFLEGKSYDLVIAADSGLSALEALGLAPDLVVGDLDSAPAPVVEQMRSRSGLAWDIHRPEKDETDMELALRKAMEQGCGRITLLGATGGRMDHFLGNLHLLLACLKQGVYAEIVDPCNRIYLLDKPAEFHKDRIYGKYVSFLPLTEEVEKITLQGFKYPLTDRTIRIGTSLCISNELTGEKAHIAFSRGILICVESQDTCVEPQGAQAFSGQGGGSVRGMEKKTRNTFNFTEVYSIINRRSDYRKPVARRNGGTMLDLKFVRENPEIVKQNIRNKFQESKLELVDQVIELDAQSRAAQAEADRLRAERNKISKQIGALMGQGKKDEAEAMKAKVNADSARLAELEETERALQEKVRTIMMTIPNIIDPSVPIGRDDSENVEVERFGDPATPDFEIPYHTEIMEYFDGIDLDSARKVAGNGFYYLMGDIARLHSAVISYARDFMIDRGFTYCVPPFMIRSEVVTGVMSFAEMDAMMYKIEGEDLYLIGTSEHSMIGKFIDTILPEEELPKTLTSYSPCFRKEKGAHGLEERGVYRIHQFEKQEMIVVCRPEESPMWYDRLWKNTVDLFRSLDIPVRTLECCSGDLADLKVKSVDVEAWSPRQQKYFEVGSCSNLGDAQARRLKIRVNGKDGKYFAHTLNNTVVAPPRMLIAFLENNLQADKSVRIPKALQPYMGGKTEIRGQK